MIHSVLQQLEILKIVEKDPKGGRRITSDGQVSLSRHWHPFESLSLQEKSVSS